MDFTRLRGYFSAFIFSLFSLISLQASADIDAAASWLATKQNSNGSIWDENSQSDVLPSTVEALIALKMANASGAGNASSAAQAYLDSLVIADAQQVAELARLKRHYPSAIDLSDIDVTLFRGVQGGYAPYLGYEGELYVTLSLLRGDLTGFIGVNRLELIGFLTSYFEQLEVSEPSSQNALKLALMHLALQANRADYNVGSHLSQISSQLFSSLSDTGWGNNLADVLAVQALLPTTASPYLLEPVVQKLLAQQLPNGSWFNDIYLTSLMTQMLAVHAQTPQVERPEGGVLSGTIEDAASGASIASATVTLDLETELLSASDSTGFFELSAINAGSYQLTISAPGYTSKVVPVAVEEGQQLNLGAVKLTKKANIAMIYGVVTDAVSGLPIDGVDLLFLGSEKSLTVTNTEGYFAMEVPSGALRVGFAKSGYTPVTHDLSVSNGQHLNFSIQLNPTDQPAGSGGFLSGFVTDPTIQGEHLWGEFRAAVPLAGVTVTELLSGETMTTGEDGEFRIQLTQGLVKIVFEKQGYENRVLDGVITTDNGVNFGVVALKRTTRKFYGSVVNSRTGEAIAGAVLATESASVQSAVDGVYELSGIQAEDSEISVVAEGYEPLSLNIESAPNTGIRYDFKLNKIRLSQIEIDTPVLNQFEFGAYENIDVTSFVRNLGQESDEVYVESELFNAQGKLLASKSVEFSHTHADNKFEVLPNDEVEVAVDWYTGNYSPGEYSVSFKVYSVLTNKLLSSKTSYFAIRPTQRIKQVQVYVTPDAINQGASSTLELGVAYLNRSNIPIVAQFSAALVKPDASELRQFSWNVELLPSQLTTTQVIESFDHLFSEAGVYELTVAQDSSTLIDTLDAKGINVVPNVSINIQQELAPSTALPEGSKRVGIKIRLEGVEVSQ